MGFLQDLLRGATAPGVMQNGMNIGISGMAEAQRQRELQAQLQREQEQQAFAQMMQGKRFNQDQQQIDQQQQNWNQTRQDNVYNNQQDDVYRDTAFRMNLENQLKQNNFEQQRINQSGAAHADNLTQAELLAQWFHDLTPEEQADVRRVQFGLQPKAGTTRQPAPVNPLERLNYGTDYATKVMGANPLQFRNQPNALDSLRNVGMSEYDSTMAAAQPVSPEEEAKLIQRESDLDQIIAALKAKHGLR